MACAHASLGHVGRRSGSSPTDSPSDSTTGFASSWLPAYAAPWSSTRSAMSMRRDVSGQRPEGVHNPPAELMPLLLDACRNQEFVRVLDSDQAVRVEEPGRDELLLQALRAPLLVAFNLCGLVLRVESSASPEDNGPTDGAGGRGTASLRCSRRPSRTSRSATSAPSVRLRPCAVDSWPSNPNAWSVEAPLTCFQSFGGPQFFRTSTPSASSSSRSCE